MGGDDGYINLFPAASLLIPYYYLFAISTKNGFIKCHVLSFPVSFLKLYDSDDTRGESFLKTPNATPTRHLLY